MIRPFASHPEVEIEFLFYPVPWSNPMGPATVFTDRWYDWQERPVIRWFPMGVGTLPWTQKYYGGPVPGPEVGELVGTEDEWVNGLDYERWIAGGYENPHGCAPLNRVQALGARQAQGITLTEPKPAWLRQAQSVEGAAILSGGIVFVSQAQTVGGLPADYGEVAESQLIEGEVEVLLIMRGIDGTPSYSDTAVLEWDEADGFALSQDEANTVRIDLRTQMSVTADSNGVRLVNDEADPGPHQQYATDAFGVKGWLPIYNPPDYPAGYALWGDGSDYPAAYADIRRLAEADLHLLAEAAMAIPTWRTTHNNGGANLAAGTPYFSRHAARRIGGAASPGYVEQGYAYATNNGTDIVYARWVGSSAADRPVDRIKSSGKYEIASANTPGTVHGVDADGNVTSLTVGGGLNLAGGSLDIGAAVARVDEVNLWTEEQVFEDRITVVGAVPSVDLVDTSTVDSGFRVEADGGYWKVRRVNDDGTAGDVLLWIHRATGLVSVGPTGLGALRETAMGYSSANKVAQLGPAALSQMLALGFDPSANASGNFSGSEVLLPRTRAFLFPNAADNDWRHLLSIGAGDEVYLGHAGTWNSANVRMRGNRSFDVQHLGGWTSAPAVATSTGAGPNATSAIDGTDLAGAVTVTTSALDTPSANATIFTLTFAQTFASNPRVLIWPANDAAWGLAYGTVRVVQSQVSTSIFNLRSSAVPLPALTAASYVWNYLLVQ